MWRIKYVRYGKKRKMNKDVKECNDIKFLKEELEKCKQCLTDVDTERTAIIEWKLKQMGQL